MPSTAADAKGLLKTAIRMEDPVFFLEHKALYRAAPARTPEPDADYLIPLGKARTVKEGDGFIDHHLRYDGPQSSCSG